MPFKNLDPEDILISTFQVHKTFTFTDTDSGSGVYGVSLIKGTDSNLYDSFSEYNSGMLEPPLYTRPEIIGDSKVPDVLLSGNHSEIEKWRLSKSLDITKSNRPDLKI